ncbi:MAG: glycosyltransferase, partial [Candidatus Nitrosotenuis sp.]
HNMKSLWIAGFPSFLGGADTELLHNIDLWREYDIDVNLVPMFGCDPKIKEYVTNLGCKVYDYDKTIFKDKIVASWCNGQFLKNLLEIMKYGKPSQVLFANCMTWLFNAEKEAHQKGWIDKFIFVSNYQEKLLVPQLEKINTTNKLKDYFPYFNTNNPMQKLQFKYKENNDYFCMGRVSRDDPAKFSSDAWNIFYKVCSPVPTKTFILGMSDKVKNKIGEPPKGLDWMYWSPNSIPVNEFYDRIQILIHKTGGSRESFGRTILESYCSGVIPIVEDNYAMPQLVIDGETGYRCKTSDEFSYRASQLAFDSNLRKKITYNGYNFLVNNLCNKDKCVDPWIKLLN